VPWKNGRYVTRQVSERRAGPLRASKASRFKFRMDSDFTTDSVEADAFTNDILKTLIKTGAFVADVATRGLFAAGFVNSTLLAADAVLKTNLNGGFMGQAVISGGSAGNHTVTGIASGDELVYVYEQNGTSGIITDLTSEFSITGTNTINNNGGTSTSGDKLVVLYLDLT